MAHLKALCRGNDTGVVRSLEAAPIRQILSCVATIAVGCGAYGMAIGLWRDPRMAVYVGVKLPLLIFLTLIVNGLLNGMLAQVLESKLSFRQTILGCLMSFAVFALILGSISPLVAFMVWNSPEAGEAGASQSHATILLANVLIIAVAGIVSNVKFYSTLQAFAKNRIVALRVLGAWLAGNLFVGAQLSWNLHHWGVQNAWAISCGFSGNFELVLADFS